VIIDREGNVRGLIEGIIFPEEFAQKIRPLLRWKYSQAAYERLPLAISPAVSNLIVKPISYFEINLPRFDEVSSTKCVAVVQQKAPVRDIHGLNCQQPVFADAFAEREIDQSVPGQVTCAVSISIKKARAVTNIRGSITAPG